MRVTGIFRIGVVAAVAAVLGAGTLLQSWRLSRAGAAPETIEFSLYIQRSDGRTADPVNLVLVGDADAAADAIRLSGALRWVPVQGSDMRFTDHGTQRVTEVQLGMPLPSGARYHMRLASASAASPRWGRYSLAAAHRDEVAPCGHIGTDFDAVRNMVASTMEGAGHRVTWMWLGNNGDVVHCGGAITRGDGWAAVIELSAPKPSPSASPSPSPSPTASPSPSPTPAATPSPSTIPTASPAASPTPTPRPIPEPPPRAGELDAAREGRR